MRDVPAKLDLVPHSCIARYLDTMDQDAFRKLLAQPRAGGAQTTSSRPSLIKKVDASQPIFAPRTAKPSKAAKAGGSDQQAKRAGLGYKKSSSSKTDGDGPSSSASGRVFNDDDMPPPVKGLDFAALERAKKQAAAEADDLDDVLEETYKTAGAAPDSTPDTTSTTTKKRTRDDLINELKAKRQKTADSTDEAKTLEEAKKQGKFRPIGAPAPKDTKTKKKKKVKPAPAPALVPAVEQQGSSASLSKPVPEQAVAKQPARVPEPQPEPEPEEGLGDMDLFDGVEEYKGLDDEEDEGEDYVEASRPPQDASPAGGNAKWFELDDGLGTLSAPPARPPTPPPVEQRVEQERSPDEPDRLVPLASSSFSIKDVLAMDQELEKEEKRRAKKDKKKKEGGGGGGEKPKMSTEAKVNRDLQKLESYTSKKRG